MIVGGGYHQLTKDILGWVLVTEEEMTDGSVGGYNQVMEDSWGWSLAEEESIVEYY